MSCCLKSAYMQLLLSFLLFSCRVPGHFHIEMRSKHHNINPPMTNLSHVVNHLSFGPVLPRSATRQLESLPKEFFSMDSTQPMNDHFYVNDRLHQAFHHYIKVVSTTLGAYGRRQNKDAILAYQMVQSSQIMNVSLSTLYCGCRILLLPRVDIFPCNTYYLNLT